MQVFAIANQKGGVGKSTTAQNLAAGLWDYYGKRVLLLDLDPQSNLSQVCGAVTDTQNADVVTILECLVGEARLYEGIQQLEKYDIVPASMFLASIDGRLTDPISRSYKLQEAIKGSSKAKEYDFIIIDTPPALGTLTANALTAADRVIIPAQADILSLQGVSQLYATVESVREYCNSRLRIAGIIMTRYNERTRIAQDMNKLFKSAATKMKTKVFETGIRENVAIKEAQASVKDIFSYDKNSNAAKDYLGLIQEIFGYQDSETEEK